MPVTLLADLKQTNITPIALRHVLYYSLNYYHYFRPAAIIYHLSINSLAFHFQTISYFLARENINYLV